MEKSHLKNSFIAAGIAVFAGVITLGANVAFGVDIPKQDPSTSGLVAPTFSGLDVRGDIKNDATGQNVKITDDDGLTITNALMVPLIKNATSVVNPVKIDDNLEITGIIKNPTNSTSILLDDDVYLSGMMDIWGIIKNSSTTGSGASAVENPVVINDKEGLRVNFGKLDTWVPILNTVGNPVEITGDLDVNASSIIGILTKSALGTGRIRANKLEVTSISNEAKASSGGVDIEVPLQISDDFKVTGKSEITKALTVNGNLFTNGNYIYLGKDDGSSEIHGMGELIMAGNLSYAAGTISGLREIKNASGKDLWINVGGALIAMKENGDIDLTGNIRGKGTDPLKFKDDIEASGSLKLQSSGNNNYQSTTGTWGAIELGPESGQQLLIDRDSIDSYGGDLTLNSWGSTNVNVGKSTDNSDLTVYGKIKSTSGFGTITKRGSTATTISGNSTGSNAASCNSGEKLLSCSNFLTGWGYVNTIDMDADAAKCTVHAKNTEGSSRKLNAYALCLDPTL